MAIATMCFFRHAELERGQKEGWERATLQPNGAANLILALFSGLMFDQEVGVSTDPAATALALADLFKPFIHA